MQYIYGTDTVQQGFNKINENFLNVPSGTTEEILQQAQEYTDQQISPILSQLYGYNFIIGGDFSTNPWQRGTSFESIGYNTYTADRFRLFSQGQCTVVKDGIWLKTTILSGNTGVNTQTTVLEIPDSMLGETVTLSFYAKASENVSSQIWIWNGNAITQQIANKTISIDITPQLYSITFKIPESLTNNYLYIWFTRLDNLPGVSVWIAKCKLESGNIVTRYISRTLTEELLLCQRYTVLVQSDISFMASTGGNVTLAYMKIPLPVEMRIFPTLSNNTGINIRGNGVSNKAVNSFTVYKKANDSVTLSLTLPEGLAANQVYWCYTTKQLILDANIY